VLSLVRAKCLPILLYATVACPLLSRNRSSFEFTVIRLFMKLFHTTSPAIAIFCQLAFNFLFVHSRVDIRTEFVPVTSLEVSKLISPIPPKSCCLDYIPTAVIKQYSSVFSEPNAYLANLSFSQGTFPFMFKHGSATPL